MRDQTDCRTLPLSLGRPARPNRLRGSGASFLAPLSPAAVQEREFQAERLARKKIGVEIAGGGVRWFFTRAEAEACQVRLLIAGFDCMVIEVPFA